MTSDDKPRFRFNPGAYRHETFEASEDPCDACARPCVWRYKGSIYALKRPAVCARCIADGNLARFLDDDHFALQAIAMQDAAPDLEREVLQRTPGVECFNPFDWPVVDGKPLAFLGYGEEQQLIAVPAVRSAMESAFAEFGWDFGPSPYALIFKEIDGERYRVVIDLD